MRAWLDFTPPRHASSEMNRPLNGRCFKDAVALLGERVATYSPTFALFEEVVEDGSPGDLSVIEVILDSHCVVLRT